MPTQRARVPVGNGPFTPLPYGLFSVADMPPVPDPHWANGILRQPEECSPAGATLDPCGLGGAVSITKAPSATGVPTTGADPFTVYAYIDCGSVGRSDDMDDRTREHLERGKERAVERVLWTGSVTTTGAPLINPHLAEDQEVIGPNGEISQLAANEVTVTGAPPVRALGLLEGSLAECYGGVGVIHVPRVMLPFLADIGAVTRDGTRLVTTNGNLVAAGAGYPGTGPDGTVDPSLLSAWMYATGAVTIYEGPVRTTDTIAESLDRSINSLVVVAERTYVIDWDCCLIAAQVDLTGCPCG